MKKVISIFLVFIVLALTGCVGSEPKVSFPDSYIADGEVYSYVYIDKNEKINKISREIDKNNTDEFIKFTAGGFYPSFNPGKRNSLCGNDERNEKHNVKDFCNSIFTFTPVAGNALVGTFGLMIQTVGTLGTNLADGSIILSKKFDTEKFKKFIVDNNLTGERERVIAEIKEDDRIFALKKKEELKKYYEEMQKIAELKRKEEVRIAELKRKEEVKIAELKRKEEDLFKVVWEWKVDGFGERNYVSTCSVAKAATNNAEITKLYASTWGNKLFNQGSLGFSNSDRAVHSDVINAGIGVLSNNYGKLTINNYNIQAGGTTLKTDIDFGVLGHKLTSFVFDFDGNLAEKKTKLIQAVLASSGAMVHNARTCRYWPKDAVDIEIHITHICAIYKQKPQIIKFLSIFLSGLSEDEIIRKTLELEGVKEIFEILLKK